MNKYEKLWFETEGKNVENLKLKYSLKFYKYVLINYGLKTARLFYKKMNFNVPYKILGDFCLFPDELKSWIKENILKELNTEKIINLFIHSVNNCITLEDDKCRDLYIKSFKELNIINDIILDKDNVLKIILNDNSEFKFLRLLKNEEEITSYERNCHDICYKKIKNYNDNIFNVVTILEKDLFNRQQYHSFIVKDNIVYDYSRNIASSFETYKTLFKPEILVDGNGKKIIDEIEELEKEDNDFQELEKWCPILKYTLYTINKNK